MSAALAACPGGGRAGARSRSPPPCQARGRGEADGSPITSTEYEEFQVRSCIRNEGFSPTYYMLGMVEEASEVFEAVHALRSWYSLGTSKEDVVAAQRIANVVKECGDVLWYATGLARSFGLSLSDLVGENFLAIEQVAADPDPQTYLMMSVGALAGKLKKFERNDYDEAKLREFLRQLMPRVFSTLDSICASVQKRLVDAAVCNKSKIEKRMAVGLLKGDGSNREDAVYLQDHLSRGGA